MRNLLFLFSVLVCSAVTAQQNSYVSLKKLISTLHPEITTDDKLLAFNVWSVNDQESREANKSFDRVYTVYEYARLKGGLRGVVVVTINQDNLSSTANIAYTKDGIRKLISVPLDDAVGIELSATRNVIFDSGGQEIYRNLAPSKIFESVNQLITR